VILSRLTPDQNGGSMEKKVLSVENLWISIRKDKPVVQDISFAICQGTVLGIVGESGSGKTMLCKAILGLLHHQSSVAITGRVLVNGKDILKISARELQSMRGNELGVIMQNPMTAFNPLIKIGGHIIETLMAHRTISKQEAYATGIAMLKKMNLPRPEEIMNSYSCSLSGGMLQRIMAAIAMASSPDILIADEPTTALDVKNQALLLDEIEKIKNEEKPGIVLVSHDLSVIARIADEVAVMKAGKIVEQGQIYQVFEEPVHSYTKELLSARLMDGRRVHC